MIDAKEYDPLDVKRKANSIREDKMELHTLLCEDTLLDTTMVIYLNWKADEMGRIADPHLRAHVKATISDDLEFHTEAFANRQIIVVDEMEDLQPYMLNLKHRLPQSMNSGPTVGGSGSSSKKNTEHSKKTEAR